LYAGNVVLSTLPAVKATERLALRDYLESQPASFYVIDSLDEIHPDDYVAVLEQVEQFVFQGDRPFVHVVVLGRASAFRDYWDRKADHLPRERLALFMLEPPRFETRGDMLVSGWNYHTWKYKLEWSASGGGPEKMPLDVYAKWAASGFPLTGLPYQVHCLPNGNMRPEVQRTLESWMMQYPLVNSMFYNLAGNDVLRGIAERYALEQVPYDERTVMEAYLAKWLERGSETHNRPSFAELEHLDLNLELLEGVAVKYLLENRVDSEGFFTVRNDDVITVDYHSRRLSFPVFRILDRSGLKNLDPRDPGNARYRFEPVWLHRLLVERHNDRSFLAMQRTAAFLPVLAARRWEPEAPPPLSVDASP
jgi:hypothetical protein